MSAPAPTLITATFKYGVPPADGAPAKLDVAGEVTGIPFTSNYSYEDKTVTVENVRGKEHAYSLDTTGFQFYKHPSKHTAFLDDAAVRAEYYPESVDIIKKLTGASRVEIFDHTIRRRKPGETGENPGRRQPVAQVHVDQTEAASITRVHRHMPAEEAPKLLANRFQIINLWRPIANSAYDWPLALCDYKSVNVRDDLYPVTIVFPDREGETFGVRYNKDHKWKYLEGMTPEEFVLIKCFDSVRDDTVAVFTPHTSFDNPIAPAGSPPRQSIEIRALVFYDY